MSTRHTSEYSATGRRCDRNPVRVCDVLGCDATAQRWCGTDVCPGHWSTVATNDCDSCPEPEDDPRGRDPEATACHRCNDTRRVPELCGNCDRPYVGVCAAAECVEAS